MTAATSPIPAALSGEEVASFEVDTELYGRDALFQACYKFTDRCYLFLRKSSATTVVVEFRRRAQSEDFATMIGEFANELIDQRLRADIARDTRAIREAIVRQAFAEGGLDGE